MKHLSMYGRIVYRLGKQRKRMMFKSRTGKLYEAARLSKSVRRLTFWMTGRHDEPTTLEKCNRLLRDAHTPEEFEKCLTFVREAERIDGRQYCTKQFVEDMRRRVNQIDSL